MQTTLVDNKLCVNVSELTPWDKNKKVAAKGIALIRNKKQIILLGLYKPLLVTDQGIVLGGNQRLLNLKEMSEWTTQHVIDFIEQSFNADDKELLFKRFYPTVEYQGVLPDEVIFKIINEVQNPFISIVNPTQEKWRLKYNLSDNDQVTQYDKDELKEFTQNIGFTEFADYAADFSEVETLAEGFDLGNESTENDKSSPANTEVKCPNCGHTFTPTKE